MRLKTFSAPSMTEALKIVKDHFGEEAIIVSSKKAGFIKFIEHFFTTKIILNLFNNIA